MIHCLSSAEHKALAEKIFDVRQKLSKSSNGFPFFEFRPGWFVPLSSGSSPPLKDKCPILPRGRHILQDFQNKLNPHIIKVKRKFPLPLSFTEKVKLFPDLPWEIYRKFLSFFFLLAVYVTLSDGLPLTGWLTRTSDC